MDTKLVYTATSGHSRLYFHKHDGKFIYGSTTAENQPATWQNYHLFELTNDMPKIGDYVYNPTGANFDNMIVKIESLNSLFTSLKNGWLKIISTTYKELNLPLINDNLVDSFCEKNNNEFAG